MTRSPRAASRRLTVRYSMIIGAALGSIIAAIMMPHCTQKAAASPTDGEVPGATMDMDIASRITDTHASVVTTSNPMPAASPPGLGTTADADRLTVPGTPI